MIKAALAPPKRPAAYTALATDGAEIDPDRHGGSGDFFLINLGRVRIPYGQPGREAELKSVTSLGYTDDDLFIVDPRDPPPGWELVGMGDTRTGPWRIWAQTALVDHVRNRPPS